ncbi:hypothetical protein A3Q56_01628 [Intoshia linei]|uniref:HMG box domain-containing protein n=1 Tax=Intoshia linei TaxID=1819745 RepID=A0A177BAM0_9BILA|nr:hypothetical protein A3Q56_01628 [Intoshia linei]
MSTAEPQPQHPKPPKRPLTPYMRFSKSMWPSVKSTHQDLTVCEIGSTIGKMWRGLTDVEKKVYNDGFLEEKKQYEVILADYMKETGLTISEIYKRGKKKESFKRNSNSQAQIKEHVRAALMKAKNNSNIRSTMQSQSYPSVSNHMQINQKDMQNRQFAIQQNPNYCRMNQGQHPNNQPQMQPPNFPQFVISGFNNGMGNPPQQYGNNPRPMMYIQNNSIPNTWNEQLPHFSQIWTNPQNNDLNGTKNQQNMVTLPGGQQGFIVQQRFNSPNMTPMSMANQTPVYIQTNPSQIAMQNQQIAIPSQIQGNAKIQAQQGQQNLQRTQQMQPSQGQGVQRIQITPVQGGQQNNLVQNVQVVSNNGNNVNVSPNNHNTELEPNNQVHIQSQLPTMVNQQFQPQYTQYSNNMEGQNGSQNMKIEGWTWPIVLNAANMQGAPSGAPNPNHVEGNDNGQIIVMQSMVPVQNNTDYIYTNQNSQVNYSTNNDSANKIIKTETASNWVNNNLNEVSDASDVQNWQNTSGYSQVTMAHDRNETEKTKTDV